MSYLKNCALFLTFAVFSLIPLGMFSQAIVVEDESATIYVDAVSGLDTNSGTSKQPFKTIGAAAKIAITNNVNNIGTKVLINPGVYRETLRISSNPNQTTSAMTFQAVTTGTAIISGSDVLIGWDHAVPNQSIYTREWSYNFGKCAVPASWPTLIQPIVQRTEMIFVNSVPLTQVLDASQMIMGTFFIDEAANQLQIWPPLGTNMSTALVENAVRPNTCCCTAAPISFFAASPFSMHDPASTSTVRL